MNCSICGVKCKYKYCSDDCRYLRKYINNLKEKESIEKYFENAS